MQSIRILTFVYNDRLNCKAAGQSYIAGTLYKSLLSFKPPLPRKGHKLEFTTTEQQGIEAFPVTFRLSKDQLPKDFPAVKKGFLGRVAELIKKLNTLSELVINWEQTDLEFFLQATGL